MNFQKMPAVPVASPVDLAAQTLYADLPSLSGTQDLQLVNDARGDAMIQTGVLEHVLLESGRVLPEARVSYAVYSTASDRALRDTEIVVLHPALTGTSRAKMLLPDAGSQGDGWWSNCIGSGINPATGKEYLLNTDRYTVICFDHFGGREVPESGLGATSALELGGVAGLVTLRDGVRIGARLLQEQFGISEVKAVVGGSMGGGQAVEWLFQDTVAVDTVFDISGCSNLDQTGKAFFQIQADFLLRNSPVSQRIESLAHVVKENLEPQRNVEAFQEAVEHVVKRFTQFEKGDLFIGESIEDSKLALTRQFGFLLFVTPEFFSNTVERGRQVSSWLDHQGRKFADRFDVKGLGNLCDMIASAPGLDMDKVVARLQAPDQPQLVRTANKGDILFPAENQLEFNRELRRHLRPTDRFFEYCSRDLRTGHDRFLTKSFLPDDAELLRGKLTGEW